jgi:hypothetical protein
VILNISENIDNSKMSKLKESLILFLKSLPCISFFQIFTLNH